MNRKFTLLVGMVAVAVALFALSGANIGTPKASADSFSETVDLLLQSPVGYAGNDANANLISPGELVDQITTLTRDVTPGAGDEGYFGVANTVWTGLIPSAALPAANVGDEAGTITFTINSGLTAPVTSNVSLTTGQPPKCGSGPIIGDTFVLYAATMAASPTVSTLDTDDNGFRQTEEDNFLANGSAGQDGIFDAVERMPAELGSIGIPALGLGTPISRGWGLAEVAPSLNVTTDVSFLVYDMTADPDIAGYLSVQLIGYPGLPGEPPDGGSITEQTVTTCVPFAVTVTVYGQTKANTTTCCAGHPAPATPGLLANRTAGPVGAYTYRVDSSSDDNYDGDAVANSYDSCRKTISTDTDLVGGADPDTDRWDSSCDAKPVSADNDGDTTVGPYNTPGIGLWPLAAGNCNKVYVPALTGGWECDQDVDGDGTLNAVDNCPVNDDRDVDNADGDGNIRTGVDWQKDTDQDGVGDVCDPAPEVKGDGTGYSVDAEPHGYPTLVPLAGYTDHDERCVDAWAVGAAEGAGGGVCIMSGADGIQYTAGDAAWNDSNDDSIDPDWFDADASGTYTAGDIIDTNSDADGDAYTDANEAVKGTDPLDRNSKPSATSWFYDADKGSVEDIYEEALSLTHNPFVTTGGMPDPAPAAVTDRNIGDVVANTARGQGFISSITATIKEVCVWQKKVGAPADGTRIKIMTDDGSGTKPSGTVIANGTTNAVTSTKIGLAYSWVCYQFGTPPSYPVSSFPTVIAKTQYHIVKERTGALDAVNYYVWGTDTTAGYPKGNASVNNGAIWTALTGEDNYFAVMMRITGGKGRGLTSHPDGDDLQRPNDRDGDGCTIAEELALTPAGSDSNPWDFYDVEVPTKGAGGGTHDQAVTILNDVLGVLEYSGTALNGPPNSKPRDFDDDKDLDKMKDGVEYDRSPAGSPSIRQGPPDGSITILSDVLLVLAATGQGSCTAVP